MNSPAPAQYRPADLTKIPVTLESPCYGMHSGRPLTPPSEPISDRALSQRSPSLAPVSERSLTPPPEPIRAIPHRTWSIQPIPYRTWRCSTAKTQDDMPRPAFIMGPSRGNDSLKPIRNPWGPPPPANHFAPSSPLSQTVSPSTSSGADSYFPCSPGLFGPRTPPPVPAGSPGLFGPRSPLPTPPVWGMALPPPPPIGHPPSMHRPWVVPQQISNLRAQPPRRVPVSMPNMCAATPANMVHIDAFPPVMSGAHGVYNEMATRSQPFKNHERFYFPDGTAWIRVKNVDYRLHRHFLAQHSSFFRTQYGGMYEYITQRALSRFPTSTRPRSI
ncbi:hypothetical protein BDZ89DRAFT_1231129 [Hymenopellis radicata]|nr:hypothetical protein BDZ89DRAFT_1231129 [Hymenopellis radicata]